MNYLRPTTWGGNGRVFSTSCSRSLFSELVLRARHADDMALVHALGSAYGQEEPEVLDLIARVKQGCLHETQRRWVCEALGSGLPTEVPRVLHNLPKKPPVVRRVA